MRSFVVAILAWSMVVVATMLFYPSGSGAVLGCMHLVGRSGECEAQQEALNAVWWQYHALPLFIAMASGYVAILIVALAGARRRRSDRRPRPRS